MQFCENHQKRWLLDLDLFYFFNHQFDLVFIFHYLLLQVCKLFEAYISCTVMLPHNDGL